MSKLSLGVQPTGPADLRRPSKVIGDVVVIDQPILAVVPATDGRDLDQIAESIWSHWVSTEDDRFAIGRDLAEARRRFPDNQGFGAWMKAQAFPFMRETGRLYRLAAEHEPEVREALANQLANGPQNFAKAVRTVLRPPVEPADAPPEPEKRRKPIRERSTLTEARRAIRSVKLNLSILGVDDVVPSAYPVLREFAGWLSTWAEQWSTSDASAPQDEGDSNENDVRGPNDLAS